MSPVSRLCIGFGLLLLVHAGYSAHEFSTLYGHQHPASSSSLPLDIQIETVVSIMLLCLGLVAGAERLKPISWNVWAGNIEKEGGGGNPFLGLEERAGFLDIRAKRAEFASWIRENGEIAQS